MRVTISCTSTKTSTSAFLHDFMTGKKTHTCIRDRVRPTRLAHDIKVYSPHMNTTPPGKVHFKLFTGYNRDHTSDCGRVV